MSQENVSVVKGIYEALGRAEMQTVFDLFHLECEINVPSRLPWGDTRGTGGSMPSWES